MNYAIISSTGLVVNTIEWDGATFWQPPAGHTAIATTEAGIGWAYANGTFIAPEPEPRPEPEPPPPTPSYTAFWDALLASTVYGSIRTQSMASLPMNTLATEFIALIGDAKAGRPNEVAIQASMDAILTTGTFTETDVDELAAILTQANLDAIYTIGGLA
jgi:hypothetical protein